MEHRPISERHRDERRRLNDTLIGRLSGDVDRLSPTLAKVAAKVGPPPAWFNTDGLTLGEVNTVGTMTKVRRSQ